MSDEGLNFKGLSKGLIPSDAIGVDFYIKKIEPHKEGGATCVVIKDWQNLDIPPPSDEWQNMGAFTVLSHPEHSPLHTLNLEVHQTAHNI